MDLGRWFLFVWTVVAMVVTLSTINVDARYHYHKGQKVNVSPPSPSDEAPAPSVPTTPAEPPPASSPSIPSGDGSLDDTAAFREAWKAASAVESATILVPSDKVFMITSTIFSGPCKPGLVFQVDGVLMPTEGPECWPKANSRKQWLVIYRLNDMKLTGNGIIEGNTHKWVSMVHICQDSGPSDGPAVNDKVLHELELSRDDCISLGTGCSNVDIDGVTCGPSHGISIGSLGVHNSQACVSNITVCNTIIRESDNGVRIKTWQGGTGSECLNQKSAVHVTDIQYRNIKGTYDVRTPPIHFACSDTMACTNITMAEVELLPEEGDLLDDPFCWNAYGIEETLTIPPIGCLQEGMP
ncbi:Detected protein of unknown function [Hibiscus syriacus]|uniref:Polygalacturonase n=1 Tax=Hibiscus syriacus TaxID=106335 RepID=A0A6A3A1Y2_HIBSY|nr:Detected protein of unknown function [Hibiscus syriacus]